MQETERYLPLMIDFSGRKVVIFGGGSVGERKAALFSDVADTTVASLGFSEKLHELEEAGKVKLFDLDLSGASDEKLLSLLEGAFLVIPATSSLSLNDRIAALAEKEGRLVNRVEFAGPAVVPSLIRRGPLMIGISTFGQSPAVSKFTRKKIENIIPPEYEGMIRLQAELRTHLKAHVAEQKRRQIILWQVLDNEKVWEKLAESYEEAARFAYALISGQVDPE
ncbi:MAG: bifunctional precorrin-2 dehydrogenase/sirohydrochlorin ferrochelatase [Methanosarcinaceae archaeon]|nr:bifunctional precorrin-2 dehydrogenase/sirohydrochlorin ferrochelatase [Methanosarcinaceae archaeon]